MSSSSAKSLAVAQLRRQLLQSQPSATEHNVVSTGFRTLDRLLPQSGLPTGAVIEWVSGGAGMRATSIALKVIAGYLKRPGALAVVDSTHSFCPAQLEQLGIPMSRLLLIRPGDSSSSSPDNVSGSFSDTNYQLSSTQRSEALWSLEQLARCAGVNVVLTWIDRLSSTAQRRLQLAVEKSGTTVILMRPSIAMNQTSWADLRFHVQSGSAKPSADVSIVGHGSRMIVSLVRSRNSVQRHGNAVLECHHETGDVFEILELASAAPADPTAV
ncbi:MAG: hypothetical protein WAO83_05440 [Fuerstiella sp.]